MDTRKNATIDAPDKDLARWQYLVARPHSWRKQLTIKGRNMSVGQLVSTVRANQPKPRRSRRSFGGSWKDRRRS